MFQERKAARDILLIFLLSIPIFGCSMSHYGHVAFVVPGGEQDLFDPSTDLTQSKLHQPENPLLDFLKKRFMDFLDTFSFRIAAGPGIRGHARVTKLIQAGAGYVGPAEGNTGGHTFPVYKLGYLKREGGLWKEHTAELGISLFYYYQTEGEFVGGNKRSWGPGDRGFWDIGLAGHWLLVGAEAEIRLDEIIDLFSGFFGYDLMDDDGVAPDPDLLYLDDETS